MQSGCPDPSVLDALVTGQLAAADRPALEAHLDVCPACSELVATLLRLFGSHAAAGSSPTPSASLALAATAAGAGAPPASASDPTTTAPAMLGRYRLGTRLGAGGMGVVFDAHDPELDRPLAVKLLHPDRTGDLEAQRARLMREAQAMARLSHPNVVAVFDVGRVGDQLFLAMERIDGTTLARWLADRRRARAEILAVFAQAGHGLAAAHAVGLVHRDFKPDNVLVGSDGRARVTDFGLARPLALDERTNLAAALHLPLAATAPGALVGTPAYMAPEQLLSEPADARSDQFAFCVALYEALFGARPFEGATLRTLAENTLAGRMRAMPAATPRWLRALIARGLARDPAARWPAMPALLDELGRDHSRRRRTLVSLAAMVGGAAAIVAVLNLATRSPLTPGATPGAGSAAVAAACDAQRIAVRDRWNAARKQSVARAIDGATRFWARNLAPKLDARLDAWADAWAGERRAACIAAGGRDLDVESRDPQLAPPTGSAAGAPNGAPAASAQGTANGAPAASAQGTAKGSPAGFANGSPDPLSLRRVACLDDALGALTGLIGELDHIDGPGLQLALQAIDALPAPARCADPIVLQRRPPRPAPALRAKLATVAPRLAIARAQIALGHAAAARPALAQLLDDPAATGDPATFADVLVTAADAMRHDGDPAAAEQLLRAATEQAPAGKADDALLAASIGLVDLYGAYLDRGDDATHWLALATDRAHDAGVDPIVASRLDQVTGAWHLRDHRWVAARTAFARAVSSLKTLLGDHDLRVADALLALATAELALENPSAALDDRRAALAIIEASSGPEHPRAAHVRALIVDALVAHGELDDAYHQAWKLAGNETVFDQDQPEYASTLATIGRAMLARPDLAKAEQFFTRALKVRQWRTARDPADAAQSMIDLIALRRAQGRPTDAITAARDAVAWLTRTTPADDPRRADADLALGDALIAAGTPALAVPIDRAALTRLEHRFGADQPVQVLARWGLGRALLASRAFRPALTTLDAATMPLDESVGTVHPQVARLCMDRAAAALGTGDRTRARELYQVAASYFTQTLGAEASETTAAQAAIKTLQN